MAFSLAFTLSEHSKWNRFDNRSFLSDRRQRVAVGDVLSDYSSVDIGVPQGSNLGVILFLIYINDLPNASDLFMRLYADDTTALESHRNLAILEETLNQKAQQLSEWFCANELKVNISKTNVMVFHPKLKPSPKLQIMLKQGNSSGQICQIPNEKDHSVKLLGLQIDEQLSMKHHLDAIFKKVNKALFFLARCKNLLPKQAMQNLYFAHIHSHFLYCLPVLSMLNMTDLFKMDKLQRKALRIAGNLSYRADVTPLFHSFHTLNCRWTFQLIRARINNINNMLGFIGLIEKINPIL